MEKQILKLFTSNEKLKFSEIEKSLKIRSNLLAYHLSNLLKKQILEKNQEFYSLAREESIPYISEKKSPLPVVLIKIGNSSSSFLIKRQKRPFQKQLALPGGRLLIGESPEKAAKRIMNEKHNIKIKNPILKSISLEHVKKSNSTIHSFLLIFIEAKTSDEIQLTSIKNNKSKIISSDYKLLTSKPSKNLKTITTNLK